MIEMRRSSDRGYADHGWLKSFHSFSFAGYRDPAHMGFGPLIVINEDRIAPGTGFGTHGHRDMEIVSYVLDGALAHRDSMGNGSVIRETHFLQIWIEPAVRGIDPGYEEKHFDASAKRGRLRLVASSDGRDGSVRIHQNASVYAGLFDGDEAATLQVAAGRRIYVHVARGSVQVDGQRLDAGDAAKITEQTSIRIDAGVQAEVLVFDLP